MRFPGDAGCQRLGTVCPVGEWADGLPEDRPHRYVRANAPAGGAGTIESPFGTIADAMSSVKAGTVVALSKGTFDEAVRLRGGVTLWGACVAETIVTNTVPSQDAATITVTREDAIIRNLQVSGRRPGLLVVSSTASVHLEDVLIADTENVAWSVLDGASATGERVVIRDTRSRAGDGLFGRALEVAGRLELGHAVIAGNRSTGVYASDMGTVVSLADVAVLDTQGRQSDGAFGRGLEANSTAQVTVSRSVFERNRSASVLVGGAGATVSLADVVVRDTAAGDGDPPAGFGLEVNDGGAIEAVRVLLERNRAAAVLVEGPEAVLALTDAVLRDGLPNDGGLFGRGVNAQYGAHVEIRRAVLTGHREASLFAGAEGTTMSIADLVVSDTEGQQSDGLFGRALVIQYGARADFQRAVLERSREIAVFVGNAELSMSDVIVRETLERDCAEEACAAFAGGIGVGSYDGASVHMTRFVVTDGALCGVQLARSGTMDLREGEISSNPIGANLQTERFDPVRISDRVVYRDNEQNLDSTALPVPDPAAL